MKQSIRNFIFVATALCLLSVAACTDVAEPVSISKSPTPSAAATHVDDGDDAPRISLADAKKAFDDGSAVFIDTHPQPAYEAGHIPGAINVTVQDFDAKFNTVPKGKKIIAYCS